MTMYPRASTAFDSGRGTANTRGRGSCRWAWLWCLLVLCLAATATAQKADAPNPTIRCEAIENGKCWDAEGNEIERAPYLDPELLASWQQSAKLADDLVNARASELQKLPEFKAYEAAIQQRNAIKQAIAARAAAKAPGHTFDFATGQLKKEPPKTAKQ